MQNADCRTSNVECRINAEQQVLIKNNGEVTAASTEPQIQRSTVVHREEDEHSRVRDSKSV
ncbi:GH24205 [Drosophila grimshawi]|uniref:GH24205 n=1 Tax=Drosophila grimshawi TaxID=7222 RepID=B4JN48_DROGR|nr:GH24205 [Drosophila grimshawi]